MYLTVIEIEIVTHCPLWAIDETKKLLEYELFCRVIHSDTKAVTRTINYLLFTPFIISRIISI